MTAEDSDQTNDAVQIEKEWVDAVTEFFLDSSSLKKDTNDQSENGRTGLFYLLDRYDWSVPIFVPDSNDAEQINFSKSLINKLAKVLNSDLQKQPFQNYCVNMVIGMREVTKRYLKKYKDSEFVNAINDYIVNQWGAIEAEVTSDEFKDLLQKRLGKRIPSWSKIAAAENPGSNFVYDSSVSWALNAIADKNNFPDYLKYFPKLKGRGDAIKQKNSEDIFPGIYAKYCDLIRKVADELKREMNLSELEPQLIEMALFVYGRGLRKGNK